jgi:hypothetical protein
LTFTLNKPDKPDIFLPLLSDLHSEVFPHFNQVLKIVAPKEVNAVNNKAKLRMAFASEFAP